MNVWTRNVHLPETGDMSHERTELMARRRHVVIEIIKETEVSLAHIVNLLNRKTLRLAVSWTRIHEAVVQKCLPFCQPPTHARGPFI